jgi:hypothetical protein
MNNITWTERAVIALAFALALYWTPGRPLGDPAYSRLATVHALTSHGTWYLDTVPEDQRPPFDTVDKVMIKGEVVDGVTTGGHIISSKPPLLPLAMTALYIVQRPVTGWDLNNEDDLIPVARVMSVVLITTSYALALLFFAKTLVVLGIRLPVRIVLLLALAFGTQLFGFATVINNHVPGAAMVLIAVYHAAALIYETVKPAWWRFAVFGLAGALACTIDMPAGIFIAAAGLALLAKFPRETFTVLLPVAAVPFAAHLAVMISITGSPFPVQTRDAAYYFPGSYWRHPVGIDALNEAKGVYLFHMTLGRKGVFSLYPITIAGLAAALCALIRPIPHRPFILAGLACLAGLTAYYCLGTNNYGGESYGFRWYIVAMPILLLMGAPLLNKPGHRWKWALVAATLAVSAYSAFECARTDWQSSQEWTCKILGPSA